MSYCDSEFHSPQLSIKSYQMGKQMMRLSSFERLHQIHDPKQK